MLTICLSLTGCGITNQDFRNAVESYQIFNVENVYEMKTVSDFINKMESFDEENDKITTFVSTSWSEEKLNEDDRFIREIKQDTDFAFDKSKYYGVLSINVCVASSVDYSTKEDFTYVYLFSLNKDKEVLPEASAIYYGNTYDYQEINPNSESIQDSMTACILITEVSTEYYK